jgi:hypothetical protein
MIDCFCSSHTPRENAEAMAELLAEADYRGHFSHGMNRLGKAQSNLPKIYQFLRFPHSIALLLQKCTSTTCTSIRRTAL